MECNSVTACSPASVSEITRTRPGFNGATLTLDPYSIESNLTLQRHQGSEQVMSRLYVARRGVMHQEY